MLLWRSYISVRTKLNVMLIKILLGGGGCLDTILPVFALSSTKIIPNTVTALFIISEQQESVSFPNESNVYMIQSHPLTY